MIGGSQGGLLVGTAITQRPELFNAAIIQVPLFDMLRYHLIGAGASWVGEYGDPRDSRAAAWLEAYSPYQQLQCGAVLSDPLDHDLDRRRPGPARPWPQGRGPARRARRALFSIIENIDGGHAAAARSPEMARQQALDYTYAMRRLVD